VPTDVLVHLDCCGVDVIQLISQQPLPMMKEADTKATRAEAALTELLIGDEHDADTDVTVTLTATLIHSIDTFHSNLTSPDELTNDEDIQRKLMVSVHIVN